MTLTNLSAEQDLASTEGIGTLVGTALERAAKSFAKNDPIATGRTGAEALHDARVALRRIRSTLRTFRSIFEPAWAANVRSELGWFGGLLGAVRQIDIIVEHAGESPAWEEETTARGLIVARLDRERAETMETMIEAGQSERYGVTLGHLHAVRYEPLFTQKADDAIPVALARILRRPWRDLRDASRQARRTHDEADLHAMRIRAKELRYAAEIAAAVKGSECTRVAKAASAIQDRLGDHRDGLFTAGYLEEVARQEPSTGFLCGQLVVAERALAGTAISELGGDLRRLKKRWRQLRFD